MTKRRDNGGPVQDPKTGKWSFVVDIGVTADGKRRQARRRGFRTKKEAKEALDVLVGQKAAKTYVPPATQRVGEYLDEWLALVADDLQASTLSSYTRVLRVHVRPRIGGVQLQRLEAVTLKTMYAELGEKLSPRTVRYVHAIVHHALRDAVELGRIVRNPADMKKAKPPKAKKGRDRMMTAWNASETKRFFALDDVQAHRDRVAWWVAVNTGLRRGELLGLRWRDVDLDAGDLTIMQTCTAIDHKIVIGPGTKTGGGRSVSIDADTVAELKALRARQAKERLAVGEGWRDHGLVFTRPDGAPLDPDRFSERFIRMAQRHPDLPRLRFHDLRHTHASILLAAGVPLAVVSKRLGHSSIAITADVYMHATKEMQSDAAERGAAWIANA